MARFTLAQLAVITQAEPHGEHECMIHGVAALDSAQPGELAFLSDAAFRHYLPATHASVVILKRTDLADCPCNALVTDNPSLSYARAATALHPQADPVGIHPTAVISTSANIDPNAWIGPNCTIGDAVKIESNTYIGPNCVIDDQCHIQQGSRLVASVTLLAGAILGERCLIHPGAVIGSDGFGLANDQGRWVKIPQLGRAVLGNDVEVGACTTIDRGALNDTLIADGVKLDNLVQIGHNCHIGEHTAAAACVGVAGSTNIGAHCTLAGMCGVNGHIELADHVHISGMTAVTRSIREPGQYTGTMPMMAHGAWRKNFARLRQLDDIVRRLNALEKSV